MAKNCVKQFSVAQDAFAREGFAQEDQESRNVTLDKEGSLDHKNLWSYARRSMFEKRENFFS
jgi:hypothetical protein